MSNAGSERAVILVGHGAAAKDCPRELVTWPSLEPRPVPSPQRSFAGFRLGRRAGTGHRCPWLQCQRYRWAFDASRFDPNRDQLNGRRGFRVVRMHLRIIVPREVMLDAGTLGAQ